MKPGFFLRACLLIVLVFASAPIPAQARPAALLSAVDCAAQSEIPPSECLALVAFYNSTAGPGWTTSTGWLSTNTPCAWLGVSCSAGHVVNINIGNNNLSGPIPPEIANLPWLDGIHLAGNHLSGSLPPQLGSLTRLEDLYLAGNQLSGSLPVELATLPSLVSITLIENRLTGSIPAQLGSMAQLSALNLAYNQLTGTIPVELANLDTLQILALSSNQLTGSIPPQLGSLTQLRYLQLDSNFLTGNIPLELGNLAQLQNLKLFNNQLSGNIPAQLGNLSQLRALDLAGNQFAGSIPVELGNLALLQVLQLGDNLLGGSIPPELANLSQLQSLQLYVNQLSGSIPPQLGSLALLQGLQLSGNQLTGSIPAQLGSLSQLDGLYLEYNQLSGSIPPELGNLPHLSGLFLSNNQLSGEIPAQLGQLAQLETLYLQSNQLSGSIPPELGTLPALYHLYLDHNQLSGNIPLEFGNLAQLHFLSISDNPLLKGPLPDSFLNLPLVMFHFNNTRLCEPVDAPFQTWLGNMPVRTSSNISCAIILLPGIMGSRLTNSPANPDCADDFFRTFGEVWFKLDKLFGLGTLVLQPDAPQPADGCNVITPAGIMDETGIQDAYSVFMKDEAHLYAGYTLQSFPYDWRLSLEDSAAKLDAQISQWRYKQVTLVGHSMGGLLARVYVSDPDRAAKVDKVITVGTPYWGAPAITMHMRGGFLPGDFHIGNLYADLPVVADIIRNSPGSMQLLPSEAYFQAAGSGYYKNIDQALATYAETKQFFTATPGMYGKQNGPLIDAAAEFHTLYDDLSSVGVDYYILAGKHLPTKALIREFPCSIALIPTICYEAFSYRLGDDTVPYISAQAGQTTTVTTFGAGELANAHGDLMKDPAILSAIKNILAGDLPKLPGLAPSAALLAPAPFLQLSVLGGADVGVTDSASHFSGIGAGGALVNEIPGATLEVFGAQTEIVLPSGQVYTVTLKQTGSYPLEMKVTELSAPTAEDAFTPSQRAVFVDIPSSVAGVATLTLDLSAGLDTLALALDQNNDGTVEQTLPPTSVLDAQQVQDVTMPVTTLTIQQSPGADGYYTGPLTAALSATDSGTGVLKTEYSLDGGRTWQLYQAPFSFPAESVHVLYARSVDNAGNSEYAWPSLRLRPEMLFLPIVTR